MSGKLAMHHRASDPCRGCWRAAAALQPMSGRLEECQGRRFCAGPARCPGEGRAGPNEPIAVGTIGGHHIGALHEMLRNRKPGFEIHCETDAVDSSKLASARTAKVVLARMIPIANDRGLPMDHLSGDECAQVDCRNEDIC